MKIYFLLMSLILLIASINGGCNLNQVEVESTNEFEPGYYKLTSVSKIDIYRCKSIVAVIFDTSVTQERAKFLVQNYGLTPIGMFDTTKLGDDWVEFIHTRIILMKLPKGAKLENYLSKFPRTSSQNFGDIAEVKFCLPVFALDSSGDPRQRLIYNHEIILSSKVDSLTTLNVLEPYKLKYISKSEWSEYKFEITHNSPSNSLSLSNSLYNHDEIKWSMPNGYAYIRLER